MADITFKPVKGRILVQPEEKQEQTAAGILLPQSTKDDLPVSGTVVVGSIDFPNDTKIFFSRYGFDAITIDEKPFCIVNEAMILGVF